MQIEHIKLSDLKNISGRLIHWLREVGVDSVERLAEEGVFELWKRMKRFHINEVTLNDLWALEGAVLNVEIEELPKVKKNELERKAVEWMKLEFKK